MATRHPTPRRKHERPARSRVTGVPWDRLLERIAAGLALMLLIARPLFPSEDADTGSGLALVGLWGLVAFVWVIGQAVRGRLCCFADWVDLGPAVLLGTILISAVRSDTPRPAINMACEWTGLILSYFLMRQLFRSPGSQRFLVVAMVSVAFALAAYGIYQVFWGLESMRAEYATQRLKVLQDLEIPPDSPQEETFRNRLNSHEPFATFALANSLAGFLVAWFPFALVWSCLRLVDYATNVVAHDGRHAGLAARTELPRAAAGAIMLLTIAVGLLLTQSRTAYVAIFTQTVLLIGLFGRPLLAQLRRRVTATALAGIGLTSAMVIAGVILLAWHRGKIDEMVFTQATKSFGYRLQYWQATTQLIRDRPWSGTGPGNFRGHYLRYKLAESSEEINDPHNMVLELVATSGLLAGAALVVTLIVAVAIVMLRRPDRPAHASPMRPIDLWLGGLAAFAIAAALSPIAPFTYLSLVALWCTASGVFTWGASLLEDDARISAIALIGTVLHLQGAGGISMPGVSQSLWAILAVGLNVSEGSREPRCLLGNRSMRVAAVCVLGVWSYFVVSVLRPVTASVSSLALGRHLLADRDLGGAAAQFRSAAAQDPLWSEPWLELARIHYERWQVSGGRSSQEQFGQAVTALEQAQRLAPSRLEPARMLAVLYEARAEQVSTFWAKAAEAYKRCVEMYPTSASLHARLARALWQSGRSDAALRMARRAWQLDAQTPHWDHKLTEADRKLIEPLQAPQAPVE